MQSQKGISLVEIMVAMVISIFLLGGVIQVYIGNRTSYIFADATARIQENGRFALETIASDVRMAGFGGCAQFLTDNDNVVNQLKTTSGNYSAAIHDFVGNPALESSVAGLNGSDDLMVRSSKPGLSVVTAAMATESSNIVVNKIGAIEENDMVIISDCVNADIFEVTSIAGNVISHSGAAQTSTPGNDSGALSHNYNLDNISPAIAVLQTTTYTIQQGASGEPALWRSVNGTNVELIDGIEQMQILFGVDTNSNDIVDRYVTGAGVGDDPIGAVRVFLVVRSDADGITDDFQSYTVNGTQNVANDNRLRQVFSVTIAVRNRV